MSVRYEDLLYSTLKTAYEPTTIEGTPCYQFRFDSFFKRWFTMGQSKPIVAVFSKNLAITNMQYAEILSLLCCYNIDNSKDDKLSVDLQFVTKKEMKECIVGLLECFNLDLIKYDTDHAEQLWNENLKTLTHLYFDILKKIIVIEHFYGSCIIYSPDFISFDLPTICALSGYIHTCGYLIYARNTLKSDESELINALKEYSAERDKRYMFVYAHELFDNNDISFINIIKYGLNDLKLYLEKHYVGEVRMFELIEHINEQLSEKVVIPICNLPTELSKDSHYNSINRSSSYWLYIDRAFDDSTLAINLGKSFYVVYEQCYKNENPMFIFDENKPAWVENTTIPHSLLAAMINVSKPWIANDMKKAKNLISIVDPFIGSGTLLIEAMKHNDSNNIIKIFGNDKKKITRIVVSENYNLLTMDLNELKMIKDAFSKDNIYKWITAEKNKVLLNIVKNIKEENLSEAELERFESESLLNHIKMYVMLRVSIKYDITLQGRLLKTQNALMDLINKEQKDLVSRICGFIQYREKQIDAVLNENTNIISYPSTFSTACAHKYQFLNPGNSQIDVEDVCVYLDNAIKYDLIITDPPYGFNTDEDLLGLATMYNGMIEGFLQSLKKEGQIILSLPDKSYTGRHLSNFTQKEIITLQIFTIAAAQNVEVIAQVYNSPNSKLYKPPYYWNSDKSLSRSIIQFHLRRKENL